ncbi:MAG: hypothetical protein AAB546_02520 [Patescibacteria group bacterium]
MMRDLSRHVAHYTPLFGIFVCGILGFWLYSYDRKFQMAVAVAVAVSYVVWGAVHHYLHKDLYWEVLFEYVMFAAVGLVVLASAIFWA